MANAEKASYCNWGKFDEKNPRLLTWEFEDGEKGSIVVPDEEFLTHMGTKQWICSNVAGAKDLAAYKSIVSEMLERLADCEWYVARGQISFALVVRALAWQKNMPEAEVREHLKKWRKEDEKAYLATVGGDAFKIVLADYRAWKMRQDNPKPGKLTIPGLDK